ncbi:hypothetical protein [Acinetobacter baumannii]|uniref:hypothetical protein n=1 Tax=Acinetobacter baumannii TaxID=470 RepID=UPI000F766AF0|nr:hypothetical protein [Acinetobacter baumannii]RSR88243.1 hypothetical protein EA664_12950 [Acinetobacter baumannii]
MTDLNKERELCNQSFEKYWDDFCEAYGNGFDRSLAKLFFANGWGEAKAQAVPEGYVLVPLEPTQEMLAAANHAPMPMVHIDSISGREKLRISTQYKAMVNVCKSGAEG